MVETFVSAVGALLVITLNSLRGMTRLLLFQKVESNGGPIKKMVLETILVHPTRRQIFAGQLDSIF